MSESLRSISDAFYERLKQMAQRLLRYERDPALPSPTELVHEAWIRLERADAAAREDPGQLLRLCAAILRSVLIDWVRSQRARKRGSGWHRTTLHDDLQVSGALEVDVLALHEALDRLAALAPRQASIVELRYFAGLTNEEAGEALGCSHRTVEDDWKVARAWLKRELSR